MWSPNLCSHNYVIWIFVVVLHLEVLIYPQLSTSHLSFLLLHLEVWSICHSWYKMSTMSCICCCRTYSKVLHSEIFILLRTMHSAITVWSVHGSSWFVEVVEKHFKLIWIQDQSESNLLCCCINQHHYLFCLIDYIKALTCVTAVVVEKFGRNTQGSAVYHFCCTTMKIILDECCVHA